MLPKTIKMQSRPSLPLFSLLILAVCALFCASHLPAANPAPVAAPLEGYQVSTNPANIALTVALRTNPVDVEGQPRNDTKHPNVFWDQDDVDHYKEMLKTSKELQVQLEILKARMDARIATPVNIPPPQKGPDGKWLYPGDYFPKLADFPTATPASLMYHHYVEDSEAVSDLGTLYALTGDEKYANYAKQLLLAYAHCNEWGTGPVFKLRSVIGLCKQLLEETLIMDHFVRGYDLIYNLPSWTTDERKQLHDDFFFPMACVYLYPGGCDKDKEGGGSFCSQVNNRGLIGLTSVIAMGYVTGDQQLIDAGLYGIHATVPKPDMVEMTHFPPRQDWASGTKENPGHGLLNTYFGPPCIPGGMWVEGTPSYAIYALGSMVDVAEICWHHGVDLYRNNNEIFKNMFDFPILMGYPDLTTPALNDAHRDTLVGGASDYEYGYRRYKDPRYLAMINPQPEKDYLAALSDPEKVKAIEDLAINPPAKKAAAPPPAEAAGAAPAEAAPTAETAPAGEAAPATPPSEVAPATPEPPPLPIATRHLELARIGAVPPAFMYDLDPTAGAVIPPSPSVNYEEVGYGILRTPTLDGKSVQSLILSSGPTSSHGHPDKLQIDLYALNDVLVPSPGVVFPYNQAIIPRWYHTTVAHNTLTVDEKLQEYRGNNPASTARADQIVFAPASTVGMQRAWTDTVYPGVTMDRAIFMTPTYLADIFGAFSTSPHKYDLAWHIRGDVSTDLKFDPMTFDENVPGYNTLTNVRQSAVADKPWSITLTRDEHIARLHAASAPAAQVIVGDGGLFYDKVTMAVTGTRQKPTAPTILERRDNTTSAIYGNALDFTGSKDGYVKGVAQQGGLDKGYGLLTVTTTAGTDLCFAAYRPGSYTAGGLETDGLQALVQMNGTEPQTLYLAGGTSLKAGNASLTRNEAGLAYVEKTLEGNYIVGNPSPSPGTVTVTLPALAGLDAVTVDAKGQKGGPAQVTKSAMRLHFNSRRERWSNLQKSSPQIRGRIPDAPSVTN